jgi:hypothetical protein
LNDGKVHFSIADKKIINLENLGVTTSASFADLNKDSWQDLIIAGEWMPVTIYINHEGSFEKQKSNKLPTGLWRSLYVTDLNEDGYPDIIAGNYGLNSKLNATPGKPLKLYVKDIDGNGTVDQLLTMLTNKKEFTFLGKDEIEKQLPHIKKTYLDYTDFAGKTAGEVFGKVLKDALVLNAQTLSSTAFINDGKGSFNEEPLPYLTQLSPAFTFCKLKLNNQDMLMSGGNFYGVLPYEGRYDAMPLSICVQDNSGNLKQSLPLPYSLLDIRGEIRDIQVLKLEDKRKLLIVARNNDSPVFLALKE